MDNVTKITDSYTVLHYSILELQPQSFIQDFNHLLKWMEGTIFEK